jgi:hypothetical protein
VIIQTADMADMLFAARDLLKDSQGIQDIGAKVEVGAPVNVDPGRCPLIQLFPLRISFPQRALGMGAGFRGQENGFVVQFQQTHPNDPEACLALLGVLVQAGTSALLSDPSLKGTVQVLGDFEVDYLGIIQGENDAIMQTATLRAVGLTTVSGG